MPTHRTAPKWSNKFLILLVYAVLSSGLSACQSIGFYSQSVAGHSRLMLAREPIDVASKKVDPAIARKLALSKSLLSFAADELALPAKKSYRSYVDLNRDYPVWIVVAAPPFSLQAKQWCYPIVGCAAYRGYFAEHRAHRYAQRIQDKGYETYVGGAAAYSTLGWFSDPLLPSMMRGSDAAFAELLFHELAHQRLYIPGNSRLNEAFATMVGEQGALRWLRLRHPDELAAYQARLGATREFSVLVAALKKRLQHVYDGGGTESAKMNAKRAEIERFRHDYQEIKSLAWGGRGYFDHWVSSEINNAKLAAYATYHALLPDLQQLFKACDQSFELLYAVLESHRGQAPSGNCAVRQK